MVARRKPGNAQGRPVPPQWVFGGVDLTTKEFFMELVPQRDAVMLIPIIQHTIQADTRIWSDEWGAYNNLNQLGYIHQTVNHSRHFVDPVTGVHTNNIESRWAACKATFKCRFGVPKDQLPSYLYEYIWRCRHPPPNTFYDLQTSGGLYTGDPPRQFCLSGSKSKEKVAMVNRLQPHGMLMVVPTPIRRPS